MRVLCTVILIGWTSEFSSSSMNGPSVFIVEVSSSASHPRTHTSMKPALSAVQQWRPAPGPTSTLRHTTGGRDTGDTGGEGAPVEGREEIALTLGSGDVRYLSISQRTWACLTVGERLQVQYSLVSQVLWHNRLNLHCHHRVLGMELHQRANSTHRQQQHTHLADRKTAVIIVRSYHI